MSTNELFAKAIQIAKTYDVSSKEDSVVVYSISFQKTKINREKAFEHVKAHPEKILIEHTECGAKLVELGCESTTSLNQEETMMIWAEASRRFIASASGDVTAFVENADPRSVFFRIELPNILQNNKIKTINHVEKSKFAKNFLKQKD